uniref:F-box domain-containing protein n=1 Tax=Anopheles farauti TaxID=69004 RepID=A0A182QB30_9DIPT
MPIVESCHRRADDTMELSDLPNEILGTIFSFLPVEELVTVSLVCTAWRDVIRTFILPKHATLHVRPVHPVTHQHVAMETVLAEQSGKAFPWANVKLTIPNEELPRRSEFVQFFQRQGHAIKSFTVQCAELTVDILAVFPTLYNLERLCVISESESRYGVVPANVEVALRSLKALKHLTLYLPSYTILRSVSFLGGTKLVSLTLERFEMELHDLKPLLNDHYRSLRELTVRAAEMKPLLALLNSYDDLKLYRLNLKSAGNEDDFADELIRLYDRQPQLRALTIVSELSLRAVDALPKKLPDLQELEIIAESINNCKALSELRHLRRLTMCLYDVRAWDETVQIAGVTELSLAVTFPLISPAIFCSFPNVHRLYLEDVDDDTLMRDIVVVRTLMESMRGVRVLDLENFVFKEREILNDGVLRFEEMEQLEGLKYSCRDMSDTSLLTMNLPYLRELVLTHCPNVTLKGVSFLVSKCSQIERLHLESNKQGLEDDALEMITRRLTHLRRLSLVNLRALTNATVDAIVANCFSLLDLTITHCVGITLEKADVIEKLSVVKSLKDLIYC